MAKAAGHLIRLGESTRALIPCGFWEVENER
jgi:hypothetical protein